MNRQQNRTELETRLAVEQLFKEGEVASVASPDPALSAAASSAAGVKYDKQQPLTYTMPDGHSTAGGHQGGVGQPRPPRFLPVSTLEDVQAIR